jgi:hypothetical protein
LTTQENGRAGNISFVGSANIASTTDANPIVVVTSAPHNAVDGDTVDISGHQVNVAANGIWQITFISATSFAIPTAGSGAGAGGATGKVQSLALGATYATPDDGDAATAASVDVALDAVADRTAWLGLMTGRYKLAGPPFLVQRTVDLTSSWETISIPSTQAPAVWTPTATPTIFSYHPSFPLQLNDIILVSADFFAKVGSYSTTRNLTFNAAAHTITLSGGAGGGTGGSFLTDGFVNGQAVTVSGSASNDGVIGILTGLTATVMTFAAGVVNEGPSTNITLSSLTGQTITSPAAATSGLHSLFGSCVFPGVADNFSRLAGSARPFSTDPNLTYGQGFSGSVHTQASFPVVASGATFKCQIKGMWFSATPPNSWSLNGDYSILFTHWRPTGMPQ